MSLLGSKFDARITPAFTIGIFDNMPKQNKCPSSFLRLVPGQHFHYRISGPSQNARFFIENNTGFLVVNFALLKI
jgi:hypothetical protein